MSSLPSSSQSDIAASDDMYPPIHYNTDRPEDDPFSILPLNRRIRVTEDVVLEWDNAKDRLRVWSWPLHNRLIVPPQDLVAHRVTHLFKFPSCMCAKDSINPNAICEAAIFRMPRGPKRPLPGQMVAACAKRKCKYFVKLETVFRNTSSDSFLVKEFPPRTIGELEAPLIEFDVDQFKIPSSSPQPLTLSARSKKGRTSSQLKRGVDNMASTPESSTQAGKRRRIEYIDSNPKIRGATTSAPGSFLRAMSPPPSSEATLFTLLMCLDDGGLSMREFERLFVVCKLCRDWVGTESSMEKHYCSLHRFPERKVSQPKQEDSVIDLTWDSDY